MTTDDTIELRDLSKMGSDEFGPPSLHGDVYVIRGRQSLYLGCRPAAEAAWVSLTGGTLESGPVHQQIKLDVPAAKLLMATLKTFLVEAERVNPPRDRQSEMIAAAIAGGKGA